MEREADTVHESRASQGSLLDSTDSRTDNNLLVAEDKVRVPSV